MRWPAGPEQPARAGGTRGPRRRLEAAAPASGCSGGRCSPRGPLACATDPRVAIAHQAAAASDSRVRAPAGPVRRPSGRPEPHSDRRSPLLQQRPEHHTAGPAGAWHTRMRRQPAPPARQAGLPARTRCDGQGPVRLTLARAALDWRRAAAAV